MTDIGDPVREVTFEPLTTPAEVPVEPSPQVEPALVPA